MTLSSARAYACGMNSSANQYRPDIDGLRAFAVLSVIAYHAAPSAFRGGFIGVDVFFVISGFLISGIILRELDEGRFSLAGFYARRIRRLLPALVIVVSGTLALGWYYLLPHEFASLGKHVLAGASYVSNLALKREAGYFDAAAEQKPLLHLWSLGIEEQFYLVWPLLLLMVRNRATLFLVICGLVLTSFSACIIQGTKNQASAFYLPQFRIWELAAGALLATGLGRVQMLSPRAALCVSVVGISMLVSAMLMASGRGTYPGPLTLLPVMGTIAVIGAGSSAAPNRLLLSHPVAVGIGLMSYSLYLWHWPLLSFASVLGVADD